jgi:hypothetical protein
VSVNIKNEIQPMITQLLKFRIVSDCAFYRFVQAMLFIMAGAVPAIVIRKLAAMDITEAELMIGSLVAMSFALLCGLLAVTFESKTKAA